MLLRNVFWSTFKASKRLGDFIEKLEEQSVLFLDPSENKKV
jgi:hypothetical protein